MNIALPALFAIAAFCSIGAIWQTIRINLPAIAELRRRVALPEQGSEVTVTFREPMMALHILSDVRRPRQVRVPAPKPVTHRLHHFAKARSVA